MPNALKNLMQKAFVDGLHNPIRRVVESGGASLEQVGNIWVTARVVDKKSSLNPSKAMAKSKLRIAGNVGIDKPH